MGGAKAGFGWQAPKTVDYLADPRVSSIPFAKLKNFLAKNGAEERILFYASMNRSRVRRRVGVQPAADWRADC